MKVKNTLKKIYKTFLFSFTFPLAFYYLLKTKIPYVSFKNVAIQVSRYTGEKGIILRQCFYKMTLAQCGQRLRVHYGAYIVYPTVKIGDDCTIEEYSIVSLCEIGNDVIVAARVSIMSGGNHHEVDQLELKFRDSLLPLKRVIIGSNIWIGTHAVIMNDIADGTVVGASSVVTKTFEPNMLLGGVPARVLRARGK